MTARRRFKKYFAPNSFYFQLLTRFLLFMVVILIIIGVGQFIFMRNFIYANKATGIQNQILAVSTEEWAKEVNRDWEAELNNSFFFLPDSEIAFITSGGKFIPLNYLSAREKDPLRLDEETYAEALNKGEKLNYKIINQATDEEQLVVLQAIAIEDKTIGVMQVSVDSAYLERMLVKQLLTFLPLTFLALIFGMLAFLPVLRKTMTPLSNIVDTVEQIDAGNLTMRFPPRQGQMEIDRLAASFNRMLERLGLSFEAEKEAKEQMRRFVADASHELRTPLTSIHGFLEVLLRGAMNQPEKLLKSLNSMYVESERMNKLVKDLLLLTKLDYTPQVEMKECALDRLIEEMEPQLRLLAGQRQVEINLEHDLVAWLDEDKIKQVVLNLFNNGVQHTDPLQGRIDLMLERAGEKVILTMQDNGAGIGKEHLPFIFDRFYRSESSRTRKYGGSGLGLAITRSIVELHGGTIEVESSEGKGSTFVVTFYR